MMTRLEFIRKNFDQRIEEAENQTDLSRSTDLRAVACEWAIGFLLDYIGKQDERIKELEARIEQNIPVTES